MRRVSHYIDLAFCVIVLPLMALIFPVERWMYYFPWYMIGVCVWLYAVYFLNRKITVPLLSKGKRGVWLAVVLLAMSLAVTGWLSSIELYTPKPSVLDILDSGIARVFPYVQQYQQAVWSLFMIATAFSFAVGLLTQVAEQKSRRREVEVERDKAELELYKAQIKPHFMFNTLNSIYGLLLTKNEDALSSLEEFISMMRYMHTSSSRDFTPLGEEADYIRQYVSIQSLRLNEMTTVKLSVDIADSDVKVPPMLLVTFVENCFKHGVSPIESSEIMIFLHEKDGQLEFHTRNKIFPVKRIGEHMGIDNCRKRLALMYPRRHKVEISSSDNIFDVKLNINLAQ